MPTWRVAEALLTLRAEVNVKWPERSTASDGTIGNRAHQKRGSASDHNPWVKDRNGVGVVTALDITHDPLTGPNCTELAEFLRKLGQAGDKRVKYVIWNRRIASAVQGWKWRTYTGINAHTKHLHLSVSYDPQFYDSEETWFPKPQPPVSPEPRSESEGIDMFIGVYAPDGRIFVVGLEGKRLITRKVADELRGLGIPERKVTSALLNTFPTLPAPS